jgi:TRAP-type C4-dicarboxylate transport system permease small subunit
MKNSNTSTKLWNIIDKALTVWCVSIMGLMTALVITSVILRYVFSLAFVWTEELIVLLFITTTYFGAILCVKQDEHIDIAFLREILPEWAGRTLKVVIGLISIVVQLALAYISLEWIQKTGSSITVGLKIPYTFIYAMFPIGFTSMAIYQTRKIINILKNKEIPVGEGE